MDKKTLNKALSLDDERIKIERELEKWERYLDNIDGLAYNVKEKDYSYNLESYVPDIVFQSFRLSAINALKLRLNEIDKEFEAL